LGRRSGATPSSAKVRASAAYDLARGIHQRAVEIEETARIMRLE
jgi:hypothetical protein